MDFFGAAKGPVDLSHCADKCVDTLHLQYLGVYAHLLLPSL